jgi:hypothetical protein
MVGRCQAAIRGFSGFPAGSLPSLRFLPSAVRKSMIARGFSVSGEPRKKFYPVFSRAAGNGRGGANPARFRPLWRRGHRLGSHCPITPRIVAVQPAPLRRRGALSAQIPHRATARASFAFAGGPNLRRLDQIVPRFWCGKARADTGSACPMQTYWKGSGRLRGGDTESQVEDFRRADPALPHRPDRQRAVAFGKAPSGSIDHQRVVAVARRRQVE